MSDVPERRFLKYYWDDGRPPLETDKYTVDTFGIIRWSGKEEGPSLQYTKDGYIRITIVDATRRYSLYRARIVASTFLGPPPELTYTPDHENRQQDDDRLVNISWESKINQANNRIRPKTLKNALIIVNDDLNKEMTAKEWAKMFKKPDGNAYRERTIRQFAQENLYGFRYKTYPNLEGEIWKRVIGSENKQGRWEVSNMCRMKYITGCAENVYSGGRLGLIKGYPAIAIHGKTEPCHIVVFKTWFPEMYAAMKPGEMILHENDDKMDFRPEKLRIGTLPMNMKDAHNNGKFEGKQKERQKCASYIDGVFEKEHESQSDAAQYLRLHGWPKAAQQNISLALDENKVRYGRIWQKI